MALLAGLQRQTLAQDAGADGDDPAAALTTQCYKDGVACTPLGNRRIEGDSVARDDAGVWRSWPRAASLATCSAVRPSQDQPRHRNPLRPIGPIASLEWSILPPPDTDSNLSTPPRRQARRGARRLALRAVVRGQRSERLWQARQPRRRWQGNGQKPERAPPQDKACTLGGARSCFTLARAYQGAGENPITHVPSPCCCVPCSWIRRHRPPPKRSPSREI